MSQLEQTYNKQEQNELKNVFENISQSIRDIFKNMPKLSTSIQSIGTNLQQSIAPGVALDSNMHDLSAVTGIVGEELKDIEGNARQTAKAFGVDAATSVESYKLLLSQLSPEIAKNSEALRNMGEHVAILSKTMGNDQVAATEVLTTAMNQYSISLKDPIQASMEMARMMNVMSAAAKEGSAELPQIKQALSEAGMTAAGSKISFEELNAAIQVLDKAGKKGAEGGVAIRNILSELSPERFQTKEVKDNLEAYGISLSQLADNNMSFTEKMRMLNPLLQDTGLLSKMFGKENMASAMALIQNADALEELTQKVTGTNTAMEQAEVVMQSYEERKGRLTQKVNDLKIKIFQLTDSFLPFMEVVGGGVFQLGEFAGGLWNIGRVAKSISLGKMTKSIKGMTLWTQISSLVTKAWGAITTGTIFRLIIPSFRALGIAIMNIPIIGWIAAIVAGLIALGVYLWNTSESFRGVLYGIWEVIKWAVGIVWEKILWLGEVIGNFFGIAWGVIKGIFKSIGGFVNEYFIQPIADSFDWLLDIVKEVWNSITNWIADLFSPLVSIWNKLFGGDSKIELVYKRGEDKGRKSFREEKENREEKEEKENKHFTALLPLSPSPKTPTPTTPMPTPTMPMPTLAGKSSSDENRGGGIKNIHITINDGLVKEMNFKQSTEMSMTKLKQKITEVLLGATNDINLVGT